MTEAKRYQKWLDSLENMDHVYMSESDNKCLIAYDCNGKKIDRFIIRGIKND